jgi:G3E family GTPase
MDELLSLTIVTGFLGSGKTTLIRRYLAGGGDRVGIVVNEYGEIGLDHLLFVHAAEKLELMASGCLCCARRNDISRALHQLVERSRSNGGSGIDHALIETSGLADPAPIIATILQDPWLRAHVRLSSVVTVLDAVNGPATLARNIEAVRQVAMADTVVITKGDLSSAHDVKLLEAEIRTRAPDARILDAHDAHLDLTELFTSDSVMPHTNDETAQIETQPTGHGTRSFVLSLEDKIDWPAFTLWLSALLHCYGDRILRVKGMVTVKSTGKPLVIQGVQHVMYPPVHIDPAAAVNQKRGLVFITAGIEQDDIERSLRTYLAAIDTRRDHPIMAPALQS